MYGATHSYYLFDGQSYYNIYVPFESTSPLQIDNGITATIRKRTFGYMFTLCSEARELVAEHLGVRLVEESIADCSPGSVEAHFHSPPPHTLSLLICSIPQSH